MKRIVHDLAPYGNDVYERTVGEFVDRFAARYGEKVSLYRFGNRAHPPASDLDLAIVVDSGTDAETLYGIVAEAKRFVRETEIRRYLFMHDILIYDTALFRARDVIQSASALQCLYGSPVPAEPVTESRQMDHLYFVAYATGAIRAFEQLSMQRTPGLREVLKTLQKAYHNFRRAGDSSMCERVRTLRTEALAYAPSAIPESFYPEVMQVRERFGRMYDERMDRLSSAFFEMLPRSGVRVFENAGIRRRHPLFLALAASYARIFREEDVCYARIHGAMYPLRQPAALPRAPYADLIRRQAEALRAACRLRQFGATQVLGPMMCHHCSPGLSVKRRLVTPLQKTLLRLQGW